VISVTDQKEKKEQDKKKNCIHEWKDVGYGFGVLRKMMFAEINT
jgi:hypothetical protein